MKIACRLLYLASFTGLALTAAPAIGRTGTPPIAGLLAWAVIVAVAAGAPGLAHRKAWPVSLALLPLGAYVVLRTQMPVPASAHGLWGQIDFYGTQLRAGANSYATQTVPFDFGAAAELKLLLTMVVYASVGLAALLALGLRRALPAIVIVLVLLGFGLTIDEVGRVVWLPLAFLFLAGCVLALSRSLERQRWRSGDAVAGAASALIAALIALCLLSATSVAASRPWRDWRTWNTGGTAATRVMFDWMEDYSALLDPRTDAEVMRVKSPLASYWRANALDRFDGISWTGDANGEAVPRDRTWGSASYVLPAVDPEVPGTLVTETFTSRSLYTHYFIVGGSPRSLVVNGDVPLFVNSSGGLAVYGQIGPRLSYTVTAVVPRVQPGDLVGRGRLYPQDVLPYTALPFPAAPAAGDRAAEETWRATVAAVPPLREWTGLDQLDRSIVGSATDPYQIALRIEDYLRLHYSYSLNPPTSSDRSPYAAFLFKTKIGYCQHFAGAMAVLLRFNGIPARVAVGFATGRRTKDGDFVVTTNDAHAWVEAYFPDVGWVPFEPTPSRRLPGAGASSTNVGFVSPFANGGGGTAPAPAPARSAAATPRPSSRQADKGGGGAGTLQIPSHRPGWLPWGLGLVAALVVWPPGRALVRRARLRRGGREARLRTSVTMLYDELRDFGFDQPRSQTLDETSGFLRERLDLDATGVVARVQTVAFGGGRATAGDLAALTAFRRELRRRLRARSGWRTTLRALYGLPAAAKGKR